MTEVINDYEGQTKTSTDKTLVPSLPITAEDLIALAEIRPGAYETSAPQRYVVVHKAGNGAYVKAKDLDWSHFSRKKGGGWNKGFVGSTTLPTGVVISKPEKVGRLKDILKTIRSYIRMVKTRLHTSRALDEKDPILAISQALFQSGRYESLEQFWADAYGCYVQKKVRSGRIDRFDLKGFRYFIENRNGGTNLPYTNVKEWWRYRNEIVHSGNHAATYRAGIKGPAKIRE